MVLPSTLIFIRFHGLTTPHRSTDDRSPTLPTIPLNRDSLHRVVEGKHNEISNNTKDAINLNRSKHYKNIGHLSTNLGDNTFGDLCTEFCVVQSCHFWGLPGGCSRAEWAN